jgi:hypothetical protein
MGILEAICHGPRPESERNSCVLDKVVGRSGNLFIEGNGHSEVELVEELKQLSGKDSALYVTQRLVGQR